MDEFLRGARRALSIVMSVIPFGLLFGAVAAENGLNMAEATLMSLTVFAGASQIVGMELFSQHVPAWLIVLSIFAVNFRHVLYSAAFVRYVTHFTLTQKLFSFFLMTDIQFAEVAQEARANPPVSFYWYLGVGLTVYTPWVLFTAVGVYLGQYITDPKVIALDVLLPVYFLGIVMGFRSQRGWVPIAAASAVGAVAGLHFFGSPWHVTAGAVAGVLMGVLLPPAKASEETGLSAMTAEDA